MQKFWLTCGAESNAALSWSLECHVPIRVNTLALRAFSNAPGVTGYQTETFVSWIVWFSALPPRVMAPLSSLTENFPEVCGIFDVRRCLGRNLGWNEATLQTT